VVDIRRMVHRDPEDTGHLCPGRHSSLRRASDPADRGREVAGEVRRPAERDSRSSWWARQSSGLDEVVADRPLSQRRRRMTGGRLG
jgi:hypothetical protein